jgi:hypothetical protein
MRLLQKKINLSKLIGYLYVAYIIIDANHNQFLYRAIGLFIIWLLMSMLDNPTKFYKSLINRFTIPVFIFLTFILITGQINGDLVYTMKQIGYYFLFFSPIIVFINFYDGEGSDEDLVYIIILAFLYVTIVSTIYYAQNPDIARRIASGLVSEINLSVIGGYSLAYSSVISATFFLEVLLNKYFTLKIKIKLLIILLIISQTLLVIYTRSTLTIIWLIVGFILVLFNNLLAKIRHKNITKVFSIVIFIFIVLIFLIFKNQIGLYLYSFNQNTTNIVNSRINSIGEFLLGYNLGTNHFIYRLSLPLVSLKSFLSSPIIGVGYQYGYYADRIYDYLGGHGEWADILGSTGLLGFIPYFLAFITFPVYNHRINLNKQFSYSYLIILFFLGLFNPLRSIHLTLTIFLFIPIFSYYYLKGSNKVKSRG